MQRQPISPLIIILAVVAFLTACTPAAHYDGRLAATIEASGYFNALVDVRELLC